MRYCISIGLLFYGALHPSVYLLLFMHLLSTDMSNSSLCAAGNHVSLCCLVMDEHVYYLV